ncbi:MAG: GntR family transcriptional regulator [Clostridia bacterium]
MKNNETLSGQIYEYLKEQIRNGAFPEGRLPTEVELAKQFFVSRITSKNALTKLAEEGLIVRIQGKGSFVRAESPHGKMLSPVRPQRHCIALVMGGYTSSFGLDVLNGALNEAQQRSCHLVVDTTNNDQAYESRIVESLIKDGVEGLIVQPAHGELYSKQILNAIYSGYPVVMLDRAMQGIDAPFVGVDNCALSCMAVQKLLDEGHTDIALLAVADERSSSIRERMDGYMAAYVNNRIAVDKDLWLVNMSGVFGEAPELLSSAYTYECYVEQIVEHLRKHPQITAIFGTEYRISKAAWDAVRRIGKQVPKDISLVSFDMDSSYVGSHTMSYIKQPQTEMGQKAVQILCDIVNGSPAETTQCLLEGQWVDGGSIAARLE